MTASVSELDSFSFLTLQEKNVRHRGVLTLIDGIAKHQETSEHAVYLNIKRLIRGLGGSKRFFKQGCFSAIVSFLHLLPAEFDFRALEDIITKELQPSSNSSKQEEGEAFLGQILAYGAMITSGYLITQDKKTQKYVFLKIFQLSSKRSYLHNAAFTFLTLYVQKTGREVLSDDFIKSLSDLSCETLDKLNYLITANEFCKKGKTMKSTLKTDSFFSIGNIRTFVKLLKCHSNVRDLKHDFFNKFAECSLKHHQFIVSFWYSLCEEADPIKNSLQGKNKSNKSSKTNKLDILLLYFCEKIFNQMSKNSDWTVSQEIFNQTTISVILRNSKRSHTTVSSLSKILCIAPDCVKLSILIKILFDRGCFSFDKITGSKLVKDVTNNLSFDGVKALVEQCKITIENSKANKISTLYAFRYLLSHQSCFREVLWMTEQLSYLFYLGFSTNSSTNRELSGQVQKILYRFLGKKFPNLEAFDSTIDTMIRDLSTLIKKDECIIKFIGGLSDAWNDALELKKKFLKDIKKSEDKNLIIALKVILGYSSLMLVNEQKTAIANIQDIKRMYNDIKANNEKMDNSEIQWIEVLLDLILNLLSKPNYEHRNMVNCIFKSICPHLTLRAFSQIIEVLEPSYNGQEMENQKEQSDNVEDSEDDNEKESDDEDGDNEDTEELDDLSPNEKLQQELRNVLMGNVSDVESIDLDEMGEEEGKALDAKLSAIFKANFKGRKTKHEKKYDINLSAFKMRVLDLIEICSGAYLPLSYWLKLVGPLVELLSSVVADKKSYFLKVRISNVINKISKAKVNIDVTEEEASDILKELLQKIAATSGIYPDIRSEVITLIKFILKTTKSFVDNLTISSLSISALYNAIHSYLAAFFKSNSSYANIFPMIINIGWHGILGLLPQIIHYVFDCDVKIHKRIEGLKIIRLFYNNIYLRKSLLQNGKNYVCHVKELLYKYISELDPTVEGNQLFMRHLMETLYLLLNTKGRDKPELIDSVKLKDILLQYLLHSPSTKGKYYKKITFKLCKILDIPLVNVKRNRMVENLDKTNEKISVEEETTKGEREEIDITCIKRKIEEEGKKHKHKKQKFNKPETVQTEVD